MDGQETSRLEGNVIAFPAPQRQVLSWSLRHIREYYLRRHGVCVDVAVAAIGKGLPGEYWTTLSLRSCVILGERQLQSE
jgi:hypothetical protein